MNTRTRTFLTFTPDRAAHALSVLIADGKISARDVTNALNRREQLIRDLRRRLVVLESGAIPRAASGKTAARTVIRKSKRKMSLARRAALQLHGRYLGHTRTLPKAAKAKIKAIRGEKGVHAAIEAARKMATPAPSRTTPGWRGVQPRQPDHQGPRQRKLAAYMQREQPRPDKYGGSGAGRQQGGSGAGRERG